jgi:hypothetical protein
LGENGFFIRNQERKTVILSGCGAKIGINGKSVEFLGEIGFSGDVFSNYQKGRFLLN